MPQNAPTTYGLVHYNGKNKELSTHDGHADGSHDGRQTVEWKRDVDQSHDRTVGRDDGVRIERVIVGWIQVNCRRVGHVEHDVGH